VLRRGAIRARLAWRRAQDPLALLPGVPDRQKAKTLPETLPRDDLRLALRRRQLAASGLLCGRIGQVRPLGLAAGLEQLDRRADVITVEIPDTAGLLPRSSIVLTCARCSASMILDCDEVEGAYERVLRCLDCGRAMPHQCENPVVDQKHHETSATSAPSKETTSAPLHVRCGRRSLRVAGIGGRRIGMRKLLGTLGLVLAICAGLALGGLEKPASARAGAGTILTFETMVGVSGPYVGAANPIRGISGGGLPWVISGGGGALDAHGHLVVHVRGLVLGPTAPPAIAGTNPLPFFRAIVSCLSIGAGGTPSIVNLETGDFPATSTGDAEIEATLALPNPCLAPIIFVTSAPLGAPPAPRWLAVTGT